VPAKDADPFVVRALARGLSILGLFDADHRSFTIDEMVERIGLPRMTVYRMARTLESESFLIRDHATNHYRLGPATHAFTYVSEDYSELVEASRPFLGSLQKTTGESVTLAVEVDGVPVCVDMINTTRPFKRQTAPGRIIGGVTSVHGKVFAAFKPPEEQARLLAGELPRSTPHTLTDPEAVAEELRRVAYEGVAYDLEGLHMSTCAVGAPVRDQVGTVVAAISVVAPSGRFGPSERESFAEAVKGAATALSAYLGWNPVQSTDR